jgi:pyruvate-formate lyase
MTLAVPDPRMLLELGEPFGAGFCECPEATPMERYARAWRRWLELGPLTAYEGGRLYPGGIRSAPGNAVMIPSYAYTFSWDGGLCERRTPEWSTAQRAAMDALRSVMEEENRKVEPIRTPHTVGGSGYTHGIVNYGRVLTEGLDAYETRVRSGLGGSVDRSTRAFHMGILDLLEGIRAWQARQVECLRQSPVAGPHRDRLLAALERVPFQPARSFYEAMVAYNIIFYLDECDNPGRLDQVLWPFYRSAPDRAEAVALLSEFADNVSANGGWSAALGGTLSDGTAAYQEMTEVVLEATHGRYRPSLELRVRPDMPDRIWEAAFDSLASGNGQPAFYNEMEYLAGLRDPALGLAEKDLVEWNGGGCTETMIHGCSNVGSLDAGFNLPLVLVSSLRRSLGNDDVTLEEIRDSFFEDLRQAIQDVLGQLNRHFVARARHRPQPVRSLLMDDCVDGGRDFNDGGARYNWSIVNVAGVANVADSLAALRKVVFGEKVVTPRQMRDVLERNFEGHEPLRRRLMAVPKFGNDDEAVDALALDVADFTYREIRAFPCARGGMFLPSNIMFETFVGAGVAVTATPDGRRAGEPLADSAGPVQGGDTHGQTAMLQSVARLPQRLAVGTPVLNMRLTKSSLESPESRRRLRVLIETYFRLGGMQLQLSVLDRAELEDAMVHPERHENLIVRIGGYSTHFNRLSPELKREVLKRTEYAL